MATASDILSAIAPQFDADANRATYLQMAETRTSSTHYGLNRVQAVAYRAAHFATVFAGAAQIDGATLGPVSSKSEGDLSVSFGKVDSGSGANFDDLTLSPYGMLLKGLRRASGTGIRTTGVPFVLGSGY